MPPPNFATASFESALDFLGRKPGDSTRFSVFFFLCGGGGGTALLTVRVSPLKVRLRT